MATLARTLSPTDFATGSTTLSSPLSATRSRADSPTRTRTAVARKLQSVFASTAFAFVGLGAAGVAHAATDLVLPSEVAVSHWKTGFMNTFADSVKKRTGGAIDVKVFPGGQLYNDKDALSAIGTGAVQMVWPVAVRLEQIDAQTGMLNLPFGLTDEAMLNQCFSDGVTKLMSSRLESRGLEVLGFLRAADLVFVLRDKDVKKLEDLKGTKIRITGGKVLLDTVRSLGASPVSMAASEMSTALSQGAIDGAFTSPAGWKEMIGTTGKHGWYVPGMSLVTYAVVIDKPWLDKLPVAQQQAVRESIAEIQKTQWKEAMDADAKVVEEIKKQGSSWTVASGDELKRWREKARANSDAFVKKYPDMAASYGKLEKDCGVGK